MVLCYSAKKTKILKKYIVWNNRALWRKYLNLAYCGLKIVFDLRYAPKVSINHERRLKLRIFPCNTVFNKKNIWRLTKTSMRSVWRAIWDSNPKNIICNDQNQELTFMNMVEFYLAQIYQKIFKPHKLFFFFLKK